MTPQSNFTIIAPIPTGQVDGLRKLLWTMNMPGLRGFANPSNALVPFGEFEALHFARFVILKDETLGDLEEFYGPKEAFRDAPIYLAFIGDCDGPPEALLAEFASRAGAGLRRIFSFCEGFDSEGDLLQWMRSHSVKPAVTYVNTIGRTVRQIREEAELHRALSKYLAALPVDDPAQQIRNDLVRLARENGLWPSPAPVATDWLIWRWVAIVAGALVILLPFLTLSLGAALFTYGILLALLGAALAVFLYQLRRHEKSDPDLRKAPRPPSNQHLRALGELQDHDVTNQYTAFGQVRPGPFARRVAAGALWLINFATPILYPRANLARIRTIHCARWVFLDGKRRLLFASNYDGSYESYMDDFVNKVAFGLNLAFSQGLNWPRTCLLLWGGAEHEQEFKNYQRRHTLPTEVWYKAYPGLALNDIARNTRIRQGLERTAMTDTEIRQWLAEI